MNREKAIGLLLHLFDENKLTFKQMKILQSHFNDAVLECDQERSDIEAEYFMGRGSSPSLPSKDTEDDFYAVKGVKVADKLRTKGVIASDKAVAAVVDIITEDTASEDFYFLD